MSDVDSDDILVLGSGESGKDLAWAMAGSGHRTAVIEQTVHRPSGRPVHALGGRGGSHGAPGGCDELITIASGRSGPL